MCSSNVSVSSAQTVFPPLRSRRPYGNRSSASGPEALLQFASAESTGTSAHGLRGTSTKAGAGVVWQADSRRGSAHFRRIKKFLRISFRSLLVVRANCKESLRTRTIDECVRHACNWSGSNKNCSLSQPAHLHDDDSGVNTVIIIFSAWRRKMHSKKPSFRVCTPSTVAVLSVRRLCAV